MEAHNFYIMFIYNNIESYQLIGIILAYYPSLMISCIKHHDRQHASGPEGGNEAML